MAFEWYRAWHGRMTDPKFRTIAKISKQPLCAVHAIWDFLMEDASMNLMKRGVTQCDAENVSSALDLEVQSVLDVISAMQGRLLEGQKLLNWEKRQPAREDNSVERTRAYRAKLKGVTQCDAGVTQCDAQDKDKDTDKDIKKINKKRKPKLDLFTFTDPVIEAAFLEFWSMYPRHDKRKPTREKFYKLCLEDPELKFKIIVGLKLQLPALARRAPDYVPMPITWLNQEGWTDEPPPKRGVIF